MSRRDLQRNAWAATLDGFSRQHEGWIVTVRVSKPDGTSRVAARDVPLRGISVVEAPPRDLVVFVGDAGRHLAHEIPNPTGVAIDETADGAQRALIIDAAEGTTTIEFRSPMRPEEVDGLPHHEG